MYAIASVVIVEHLNGWCVRPTIRTAVWSSETLEDVVCVRSAGISASIAVGVQLETLEVPEGEDRDKRGTVAEAGDLLLPPRWLDDISEGLDQLDPVLVVSRHPISFFILLNGPYAWMREQLEGGSNLFGGWDIVRVLHAHDDPPDVLRCLHGSISTLENSNDRKQGLSSIDPVLDVLIEEVESVILEGP
ncbi:hypothetical protein PM022_17845 [Halorubrum ezzemoulense]|uniref:hypothetical protein n=1 Tax=Halorubrum ezzemoulense TaxID=337243 RepID=UPI00232F8C48|nr:hypothetical protein [Halorubrum ezzemoulense]MDB2276362.1 hypothetical protein [Halorubrum ezzemoulense]